MARTTIKDLARELGVAPSTISRALSDHPGISVKLKEKVNKLAQELNYTPNLQARFLQSRRANIIALILPEIGAFFVPEMIYGVNTAASEQDFSVVILPSDNKFEREKQLMDYAVNVPAEGILLSVTEETNSDEHIKRIQSMGLSCVLIDRIIDNSDTSFVATDDSKAAALATQYLLEKGHKHILGMFGNPILSMTKHRRAGFLEALGSHPRTQNTSPQELSIQYVLETDKILEEYLNKHPEITAIFTMSDELLVYVHHSLMRQGRRIPEEISIISISDGEAPYYLYPNITYINHSGFEVGIKAVEMLFEQMSAPKNEPPKRQSTYVSNRVFELDSVKKLES
jgi:LacI family transcriptional regulator